MKHKLLLFFLIITTQIFSQSKNQTIGFKENKGQIIDQKGKSNDAVKYLLNSNGLNVQLRKNGFSYDVYEVKKSPSKEPRNERELSSHFQNNQKEERDSYNLEYTFHRIDIYFVNSNSKVKLITDQKSKDFDNYYNVPNKPEGITGVYQYKQITYKNIYPNIDVVFSIPNDPHKTVEYNFVIHPKGKISDIQLKFNGAETDLVDNKIQMNVRFGKMEETLPASWIEDGSSKKEISVGYRKIKKDLYGFTSSDEASNKTVIIDPVPTRLWGTYYGGAGDENRFNGIVKTNQKNVYIGGYTGSSNNISTSGTHQININTPYDAFITKFDENGERLWGTYYGGSHTDEFRDIAFDSNNNIYAAGYTGSNDNVSTTNSHQKDYNTNYDGMLVKFNENGQRIWGTYYGGENQDEIYSVKIDKNQNVYVGGYSSSLSKIATSGSFRSSIEKTTYTNQFPDGFLAKFTVGGTLIWATYYGSVGADWIFSIDLDSNNNIFCSGITNGSTEGIATPGAYDETLNGTWNDTFVVKFNSNGERIFGTYYGGGDYDNNDYIKVDHEDNFIISGETRSTDGIGILNSHQPIKGGYYNSDFDSYIAKFNNNGKLVWSTYYGGEENDGGNYGNTLDIDENNNIYFYTSGYSKTNISTSDAYQKEVGLFGGSTYIVKFKPDGQRIWGTYYGNDSYSGQICYVEKGKFYISGWTNSSSNFTTPGAHQNIIGGSYDSFLIKFEDCFSNSSASSNSPICTGNSLELKASGGTNYSWTGPNGFISTDQNPTIINATNVNSGEYSCVITGTGGCDDTKKVNVVIGDIQAPIPDIATLPTITGDCHTVINMIPTATDACAAAITGSTTNPLSYSLPGTYTIVWNYDDGNGNISHQNQTVTITNQPIPTANTLQTFCIQQNATLNHIQIAGQNIKWYDAQTAGKKFPNTALLQNGTTYYASQTINGCESERIPVSINIQNTLPPTGNTNQTFCSVQNPIIANLDVTGDLIKWHDALNGGSLLTETTNLVNGKTYYASQTINNCEGPKLGITISIVNTPSVPTGSTTQAFCKSENAILNNIQISGQNIKWYDTNFAAAALPNTTLLEDNRTYYASQTIGCEGDRTPILVHVYDTALPNGDGNQQFCFDENATIDNIAITGTAIKWYDSAVSGTILPQTTLLQNGIYYATQTLNNCESQRFGVTVKIPDTQKPSAQTPQPFCIQQKATIKNIDIMGQDIKWFENLTSKINLSESTILQNGITYYASQTINNCESDRIPITVQILEATNANCIKFIDELPYPKFFTPNNDNYNDTWTIDFAYLAPRTKIKIFDRYGKLIKELYEDDTWDGNYLRQQQPSSDYWFIVTLLNGTEFRGHFSLKR